MNSIRAVLLSTATALCVVCASSAMAADSYAPRTAAVRVDDLNLQSESGAKTLYMRLRGAARSVCSRLEGRDLRQREVWQSCYDGALTKAVTDLNVERVTALHQRTRGERTS